MPKTSESNYSQDFSARSYPSTTTTLDSIHDEAQINAVGVNNVFRIYLASIIKTHDIV